MVDGEIQVVLDSDENNEEVRNHVKLQLTTGCKCVTGCDTNRCGCRKDRKSCSAGCHCKNCLNVSTAVPTDTSTPDKQMIIVATSEQVCAKSWETELRYCRPDQLHGRKWCPLPQWHWGNLTGATVRLSRCYCEENFLTRLILTLVQIMEANLYVCTLYCLYHVLTSASPSLVPSLVQCMCLCDGYLLMSTSEV